MKPRCAARSSSRQRGLYSTHPNPRVGAVLARDEEIVGEGWHERAGEPHAEPIAIRAAGERARGATAYVTLEPCSHHGRTPPCVDVLLAAGVRRVVYAVGDPNPRVNGAGAERLQGSGSSRCESGLLAAEAEALNAGFLMRMRQRRPFVRLKSGASLDGRTALANGESKWITSEAARADVQHWRAQSGAVLTSAATVLADDPRLDVRIETPRQPMRVVLDRRRAVRKTARILAPPGEVLVFAAPTAQRKARPGRRAPGQRARRARARRARRTSICSAVFARLARARDQRRAGGGGAAARRARCSPPGLVDEWLLYLAPKLLGKDAKPLAALAATHEARRRAASSSCSIRSRSGPDLRLRLQPTPGKRSRCSPASCRKSARSGAAKRAPVRRRRRRSAHRGRHSRPSRASGSTSATASAWMASASPWPRSAPTVFIADVSGETLRVTTLGAKRAGARVNLEPALARRRQPRRSLGFRPRRRHRRGACHRARCALAARRIRGAEAAGALHRAQGFGDARWREPHRQRSRWREVHHQPHSAHARSHHARRARARCARQSRNRSAGALRRAACNRKPT